MISLRFVLLFCLHYASFTLSSFLSVKDQMYADIVASNPCFLRLNGTNQFGCTSSRFGNVGTLHLLKNLTDLDWLINEGMADPYTVALTPKMFNNKVLQQIELNYNKVNGIILFMNGTNQEVIDDDDLLKNGFSPEDTCPNRYSDISSCPSQPWNPYGTDILLKSWSFPIFVVYNQNTIKEIIDCFEKNNLPLNNQNDHSLCALELKSHMYAAVDSKTCTRRTILSYQNLRPTKFCDPLGDKNVYWSLKEFQPDTLNQSVAIIAARLDATSMFQDLAPGALSTATSIVTLMATANLISEMLPYDDAKNYSKNIMFILFNGEAYNYIGSSRVAYDMYMQNFPNDVIKLQQNHIGLFVELSQIHYKKEVVFHRHIKYNISENVENFMNIFNKSLSKDEFKIIDSKSLSIPPASLHSFLKRDPHFPGVVLTGFNDKFRNKFYHSILDDANNLKYDVISQTIASISTSLSHSLYTFLTNNTYQGSKEVNTSYVTKLLDCYVKSINCELFKSLTSPLVLPDRPPNYYISIDLITNTLTSLSRLLFASFGNKINEVQNEENCIDYETKPFLLQIGNGEYLLLNPDSDEYSIEIKPSLLSKNIIKDVFGNIIFNLENVFIFSQFAILAPKNEHCDEINNSIVNMLPGLEKTYLSLNTVSKDYDDFLVSTEFLDSLHLSGLPPHSLGFLSVWLNGNYNACYLTTSNFTDAVSPAFIIPDYDLSSTEYSTWTESVWHEVQIRMFLKQSFRLQIIIFILGVSTFLFSFLLTRKMYAQSGTYFNNQESNSVTSC